MLPETASGERQVRVATPTSFPASEPLFSNKYMYTSIPFLCTPRNIGSNVVLLRRCMNPNRSISVLLVAPHLDINEFQIPHELAIPTHHDWQHCRVIQDAVDILSVLFERPALVPSIVHAVIVVPFV